MKRLVFQGAGHNDVELYSVYLERLRQFVMVELDNWQMLAGEDVTFSSGTSSSVGEKLL